MMPSMAGMYSIVPAFMLIDSEKNRALANGQPLTESK